MAGTTLTRGTNDHAMAVNSNSLSIFCFAKLDEDQDTVAQQSPGLTLRPDFTRIVSSIEQYADLGRRL